MTTEEIRHERALLEERIRQQLISFKLKTGANVIGVRVSYVDSSTLVAPDTRLTFVDIDLERI